MNTDFKNITLSNSTLGNITLNNASASGVVNRCDDPNSFAVKCVEGILLTPWVSETTPTIGMIVLRAFVYFIGLMYLFLGVSIVSDRFMAAIEVITSQEREVKVKMKNGDTQIVSVAVWNKTVSNLTLMALGSSAPEILLSIIEICGKNFEAGDLGPGTIVGSAAFNLFVIIGLCICVLPPGQSRRIKHLSVFFITATWSIFAYMWMYFILSVVSPNEVQVWEALLTFAFFFLTVITAYIADTKIFFKRFLPNKKLRAAHLKALELGANGDTEAQGDDFVVLKPLSDKEELAQEVHEFEKHRMEYIEILRDIRKRHPNIETKQLEEMAQLEVLSRGPKSRAFYRMQATRALTGGGNVIKKSKVESLTHDQTPQKTDEDDDENVQKVFFDPGHYTVMENVGTFYVTVSRSGGSMETSVSVDYATMDGTATQNEDYVATSGTIVFYPGEQHKLVPITIIDDDVFEEDEHFFMRLSNLRAQSDGNPPMKIRLANPSQATIMVLDDDHAGIFHFEQKQMSVAESKGFAEVKVMRSSGARGIVRVPYQTINGTAHGNGKDYEDVEGYLEFKNDQTEAIIPIRIIDDNQYEKRESFYVQLGQPFVVRRHDEVEDSTCFTSLKSTSVDESGAPKLGEITKIEVTIEESKEFKNTVDKLLKSGNWSLVVGTSSWKEQFIEAITVNPGGEDDELVGTPDGEEEEKLPSFMDYLMHFLTIFWKVLFAFVPPTDYLGGWLCFVVSIIMIGVLTALIGDVASHFGCTVGLSDAVTAISLVAMGTSLPDTFASKVAAINDEYADSSIGNVTGSNAVNVFLGIGVAWSIAAVVHFFRGTVFKVSAGSLGFSVTTFCIFALVAIILLLVRRRHGGELGGPAGFKYFSSTVLFGLWGLYIALASLENYCVIVPGF